MLSGEGVRVTVSYYKKYSRFSPLFMKFRSSLKGAGVDGVLHIFPYNSNNTEIEK